jgi:hypothetical protein
LIHEGEDRVNADPFPIALVEVHGMAVVAEEVWSGNPSRPKIPNVGAARRIRYVKLLGLMDDLGWTFWVGEGFRGATRLPAWRGAM